MLDEETMDQGQLKLNNGVAIPQIGFGTWKIPDGEPVITAVRSAIQAGYRLIDTAMIYNNEIGVGEGIRLSGVPREEIFLTTKLWNEDQGYETTLRAFDESLKRLGVNYVDLYLMHWPIPHKRNETWRAMQEIYTSGRARSIGVSNFLVRHLEELLQHTEVVPAVNQVEFHPFLYDQQSEILLYCKQKGITLEAYSPLAHAHKLEDPIITEVAAKYNKTNAQVLLRWAIQKGGVAIPKSTNEKRMKENISVFDFKLEEGDIKKLDSLGQNLRTCNDPNTME